MVQINDILTTQTADFQRLAQLTALIASQQATAEEKKEFLILNAKSQALAQQIEQENEVIVVLAKIVNNFKESYRTKQLADFQSVEKFLRDSLALLPKKKGSKDTENTGIQPIKGEPRLNSYAYVVKHSLIKAGSKGMTVSELGKEVVKVKPETDRLNSLGTKPLWDVYVKRAADWFPETVTKSTRNNEILFTWTEPATDSQATATDK